jgi:N-acetylglucosaminyl-diphospho-decaprenol L-rhamnosyltransferase
VPRLDIIVVDYNAGELVRACIRSIADHPPSVCQLGSVIVVDNASQVPTRAWVQELGLTVTLLRNETNQGFARACNQGASLGDAEYLLLLNPDTEVLSDSLDAPVQFLEDPANEDIGIVGIQLVDATGRVTPTCSQHPRLIHFVNKALGLDRIAPGRFCSGQLLGWDHLESRRVDGVMGAFFLVRRSLWDRLGGLDERFFVYFEEAEFSVRASQLGSGSYFLADARATHHGAGTTGSMQATRLFFSYQSRLRFARKHFGFGAYAGVLLLTLIVEPLSRVIFALARRVPRSATEVIQGARMAWRWILTGDEGPATRRSSSSVISEVD